MEKDDMAARIEAFDQANGGGVGWYKDNGAYHLYLHATEVRRDNQSENGASIKGSSALLVQIGG